MIASLNGTTAQGWVEHAKRLEQAGAAALELNVYSIPIDLDVSAAALEQQYIDIVREVRSTVRIPISIKLAPYFSTLPNLAAGLVGAGVDGLVLFNRFFAPDIDLQTLRMTRSLPLSSAAELPLSLVWIGLLSRRLKCSLAASRGVRDRDRGREVSAGRCRRGHDYLGVAATRSAAPRRDARRARALARGKSLRLRRCDSWSKGCHACRGCRCVSACPIRSVSARLRTWKAGPVEAVLTTITPGTT